jgi:quercetin dioxygenase-like cupin family protein
MALPHAQPLDIIDLRPLGAALAPTRSHSLLRTNTLQLMRVVLLAGQGMPEHHIEGEACIQCTEGLVVVGTTAGDKLLQPGCAVVLPPGEPHALYAQQDSSLIVFMLLRPHSPVA